MDDLPVKSGFAVVVGFSSHWRSVEIDTMATGNLPSLILPRTDEGKRICQVIKVKPEHLEEYKKVCRVADAPSLFILRRCQNRFAFALLRPARARSAFPLLADPRSTPTCGPKCSRRCVAPTSSVRDCVRLIIRYLRPTLDYSIHYFEPHSLLIAHMRYVGPPEDFQKDMEKIGEDEHTRKWWKVGLADVLGAPSRLGIERIYPLTADD